MFTVLAGYDLHQPTENPCFQWDNTRVYLSNFCDVHETERIIIILYGDLYNLCIEDVYKDPSILADEQGSLCYLVYDKKSDKLHVGTDKLGFGALYYNQTSDGFVIACCLPHIKWRLKNPEANWLAWEEILNTGDIIGEKTPLLNVNRLRANEILRVLDRRVELTSISSVYTHDLAEFNMDFCIDNNELLSHALEKSALHKKQKIIPLSGGHDSRRLAITAKSLGFDFIAVTQSWVDKTGYDLDTAIAKVVAEKLDVPHQISSVCDESTRICNELTKDYWIGFESEYHAWALPMIKSIDKPSLIYDGIVADVTVNAHYMRELAAKGIDPLNKESLVKFICGRRLFEFKQGDGSALEHRVQHELELHHGEGSPINLYMLSNHTRRNIGAWINLFKQAGHSIFLPYTDFNFFSHSMAACNQTKPIPFLQKECMRLLNSEVSEISSTRDTPVDDLITKFTPQSLDCRADYPSFIKIHPEVRAKLVLDWMDKVVLRLDSFGVRISAKAWKVKRLKRLSLFLNWLDTQEGDLPAAALEQPDFLTNFHQQVMARNAD